MVHHARRSNNLAIRRNIVGNVEQCGNEQLVSRDSFRLHNVTRRTLCHQLGHEAAFGAKWYNGGVLHPPRLHQPQNPSAESLRPVGPTDAAAGDLAKSQVHAFNARRIDKDLVERPRKRQVGEFAAFELERDQRLQLTVILRLEVIRSYRRLDRIDETTEDAVFIQTFNLLQTFFYTRGEITLAPPTVLFRTRIETRVKEFDDLRRNACMLYQRRPHVVLRIRQANLPQKAGNRSDQRNVAPTKAAMESQGVVAVVFGDAAHHHEKC